MIISNMKFTFHKPYNNLFNRKISCMWENLYLPSPILGYHYAGIRRFWIKNLIISGEIVNGYVECLAWEFPDRRNLKWFYLLNHIWTFSSILTIWILFWPENQNYLLKKFLFTWQSNNLLTIVKPNKCFIV